MSTPSLALRQVRYEYRSFWRNPAAAFFTFAFPLMFVVLFNAIFTGNYEFEGKIVSLRTFYTPALIGFSVISACYSNIAIGVVFARDEGVLKRIRGTPLPPWVYLFGRIANSIIIAMILVVIVATFSALVYGVDIPSKTLPAFLATLGLGAACFCALGLAITAAVPNADAAPAVINASILPLLFISNIFIPLEDPPKVIEVISNIFPVRHLSHALHTSFIAPPGSGAGFVSEDLLVLGAWMAVGVVAALRFFDWEPRT